MITTTTMKAQLLILCLCSCLAASTAIDSRSDGVGEWSLLTKLNFSSQIRLHPHILLLVTVPWSGESRSLMRDISILVTNRKEEINALSLMVIHRNTEKMLADAIGAMSDEITVLYYHHSVAYKYRGILRAQSILFSISSHISALPGELPIKSLSTPAELKTFLDSTDKALLLLEFCGWTPKLLAKGKRNVTEYGYGGQDFVGWTNRRSTVMGIDMQKDVEAKITCDIDNEVNKVPWLVDFGSVNDTTTFEETANSMPDVLSSCTLEEYRQFDSFFTKFMTVAKDHFLPSERHRYGLVSERSMASTLGIGEFSSWLAVLHFSGCPCCLKVIKKEDDLNDIFHMDNSVLSELEGDGHTLKPVLPSNRPSILLFVDRSSDLEGIRSKSKEILDDFRELALHIHNSYQVSEISGRKHERLFQDYQALRSTSEPPRLKLSRSARLIRLKEKMSAIMIVNEGKQVTFDKLSSDVQGSSLHEILKYVLQQKKESKLSSLANELGFQLLSDDIDINLINKLPSHTENQYDPVSPKVATEGIVLRDVDGDQDQPTDEPNLSDQELLLTSKVTGPELHHQEDEEKKGDEYIQLSSESENFVSDHELDAAGDIKVEETSSLQGDKSEHQQFKFTGLKGSFFFFDGNYQSLQALTGASRIPQLVIVDPALEQHYVFPEENDLNYSSMADFLVEFLNGSLPPYRQSESNLLTPREAMQPPFVNVEFHEADAIPRLTSNSFSELVFRVDQVDSDAWDKDALVLFSNRWCGFCQRMELVFREVYRAMKGYISTSKSGSSNGDKMLHGDNLKDVKPNIPSMYFLDCTLNDCSLILRSINQTEVYPALVLFPAEKKDPIPYEGHTGVSEIIKFIADHGSNSKHLIYETGILRSIGQNDGAGQNVHGTASSTSNPQEIATAKDRFHEVVLANQGPKPAVKHDKLKSSSSTSPNRKNLPHVAVGSVLTATNKLQNADPFGQSKILIVKADQSTGFQGLIFNKRIRWDALHKMEDGFDILAEAPLSYGGPLVQRGAPLVALTRIGMEDKYPQILPNIYYLDQSATYDKIGEFKLGSESITDYWFFLGYSSWGWDQLFDEIEEGAWNTNDDGLTDFAWP